MDVLGEFFGKNFKIKNKKFNHDSKMDHESR